MPATAAPRFQLPVTLDVTGRRCVVAGGGPLAAEKAAAFRAAGADVVEVPAGAFSDEVLDGAFVLVISGEDDLDTAAAFAEAERRGVLTNALDDVPHCHFAFPSLVERGPVKVAVSTGGQAPALARRLRLDLERRLHPGLGTLVAAYAEARRAALPRQVPFATWAAAWHAALDDLDGLLERCESGDPDAASAQLSATVAAALAAPTSGSDDPHPADVEHR